MEQCSFADPSFLGGAVGDGNIEGSAFKKAMACQAEKQYGYIK